MIFSTRQSAGEPPDRGPTPPSAPAALEAAVVVAQPAAALEAAVVVAQPAVEALARCLGWERRIALLLTLAVVGDRTNYPALLDPVETRSPAWIAAERGLNADDPDLYDAATWGGWPTPPPAAAHQHAAAVGYPSLFSSLAADVWEDAAGGLATALDCPFLRALRTLARAVCGRWGVPAPQFSPPAEGAPTDA